LVDDRKLALAEPHFVADPFEATQSIAICAFTPDRPQRPVLAWPVEPNSPMGLGSTQPPDGRQDHDRAQAKPWPAAPPAGRRRHPPSQAAALLFLGLTRPITWRAGSGDSPEAAVDDAFDATQSVTICAFTTDPTEAPLFRLPIQPTSMNGLARPSLLVVDKITTAPKQRLGSRLGVVAADDMRRLNQAALLFLGLELPVRE
jgi:mRNA interferase MazF